MRVMLIEDQVLLREGLAGLFRDAGHDVIGSYGHADGLADLVAEQKPDIVVLDIRLPPTHTDEGTRAAAEIKAAHPAIGVLLLSQHVETAHTVDLV
ncbi:MAG TPA: response regulator, partial [Micromonosporaceae bacterium]